MVSDSGLAGRVGRAGALQLSITGRFPLMSEYELSLLRQRGLAARDAKAGRGELRFTLPPGYCWAENGRIEIDPDERVADAIRLVFEKFRELGSSRQVYLWFLAGGLSLPVVRRNSVARHIEWRAAAYHTVRQILKSPIYAGAYAFGRTGARTRIVDGRARKTEGHKRPITDWGVLLRDHHEGYITWERFEENQRTLLENAHMKKRASRKSGRGGRALLSGLARCGRCGRMMRGVLPESVGPSVSLPVPGRRQRRGSMQWQSAGCVSTVLSPRAFWTQSRRMRWRRRCRRPSRLTGRRPSAGARWSGSLKRPSTKPRLRPAATSWWLIPPSGTSRGSWRRGGTPRLSASSRSRNAWSGWTPSGRRVPRFDRVALMDLAQRSSRGVERTDDERGDEATLDPHPDRGSRDRPG